MKRGLSKKKNLTGKDTQRSFEGGKEGSPPSAKDLGKDRDPKERGRRFPEDGQQGRIFFTQVVD